MQSLERSLHPAGSSSSAWEPDEEKTEDVPGPVAVLHDQPQQKSKNVQGMDRSRRQRRWIIAAVSGAGVVILAALYHSRPLPDPRPEPQARSAAAAYTNAAAMKSAPALESARATLPETNSVSPPTPAAPMIARTVALTLVVKDIAASRAGLDQILARNHGYMAQLNINTPEDGARSFTASLRIPAPQLAAALAGLRQLGRVQSESQSGEEVTQQHADLVARLRNARETEQRLLAILQQRTGKVEEVLQVEEQISNTRGEIERMEAEQKALDRRVDFATVELQLTEVYKAQLASPSSSIGTRVHNAFVNGLAGAGNTVLGILLFCEEYGPVLLVWLAVLGVPLWLVWRRYRKAVART